MGLAMGTTELLTTKEAADILGVSVKTVRRWADGPSLPVVRTPGDHRRYRRSDVEALLAFPAEPEDGAA